MAKKAAARKTGARKTGARKAGARKTSARKTAGAKGAAGSRKTGARKSTGSLNTGKRKGSAKRELIDTGVDKRFVRRNPQGEFKESDDVGRSLSRDQRTQAKTKARRGQGDKGDR
jgi:hypothetical protein